MDLVAPLARISWPSQSWGHLEMVGMCAVTLGLADQSYLLAQGHRASACWTPNCATCWMESSSSMVSLSLPCS